MRRCRKQRRHVGDVARDERPVGCVDRAAQTQAENVTELPPVGLLEGNGRPVILDDTERSGRGCRELLVERDRFHLAQQNERTGGKRAQTDE